MNAADFTVLHPFTGVYHIRDALGAHMTLLVGRERALLFDTGYGLGDLRAEVRTITPLPLTVVCSHAHYDHLLGARWFPEVWLSAGELPACRAGACPAHRGRVLRRAQSAGLNLTETEKRAYLRAAGTEYRPLAVREFDLGGLRARVWPMPGHTRGSVGLWVEEPRLLLAGDNLNPVVWMFFGDCTSLAQYSATVRDLLYLPFAYALCPHADRPLARAAVEEYAEGLCPETYLRAKPVAIPPYRDIETRECAPAGGFTLVFDGTRAQADGSLSR